MAPSSLERLEPPDDWQESPVAVRSPVAAADGATTGGQGRAYALALGTAVHLVLERVPLDDDATLDTLAAEAAASVGREARVELDLGRVATLARAVWRAAPLRAAARAAACAPGGGAAGVYRELPITCCRPDGLIIEGAIDLAYHDDELGGWVIVDYKTDARLDPAAVRERYGGQAAAYALALEAAAAEPVVAIDIVLAAHAGPDGAAMVVRLVHDDALRGLLDDRVHTPDGLVS